MPDADVDLGQPASIHVLNVGGADATVQEVAEIVERSVPGIQVGFGDQALPLPAGVDGSGLNSLIGDRVEFRSLERGVVDSITQFRRLIDGGLIGSPE